MVVSLVEFNLVSQPWSSLGLCNPPLSWEHDEDAGSLSAGFCIGSKNGGEGPITEGRTVEEPVTVHNIIISTQLERTRAKDDGVAFHS